MKPKKRDQQLFEDSASRFEQIQADHELFLQAFEKPTQIYRYLRARNLVSPIFLHRTLRYMKGRCTRKANSRENFKVDSLLAKRETIIKKKTLKQICKANYMNIAFIGFYDKDIDESAVVKVHTSIVRKWTTVRKQVASTAEATTFDTVTVPCNPSVSAAQTACAVSIAGDNFRRSNGYTPSCYLLMIHVTCRHRSSDVSIPHVNGVCNGTTAADTTAMFAPPPVKRRRCRTSCDESPELTTSDRWSTCQFNADLLAYDQRERVCQLTDGYYELALRPADHVTTPAGRHGDVSWHGILDTHSLSGPFDALKSCPTLKFRLTWMNTPQKGIVNCDTPVLPTEICEPSPDARHENGVLPPTVAQSTSPRRPHKRVFYQFVYKNGARQQTQSRPDCHCPWCGINCLCLFALIRHLRYCHARFTFNYSEHPKGARIDVSINECYDGAYAGNPHDTHSHIGYAFCRRGPVRRTPVTYVILYNRRRLNWDQLDIGQDESEAATSRPIVQGHDRLYYHSVTSQPVRPCEIEAASVDKNDPEWSRQKTVHLIDDFTDVNEGEKEIMKMWNLHIMHYNYIGDCSLGRACEMFIRDYGERLIRDKLTRNFILHLANLYDFGLVRPELVRRTVLQLHWLEVRQQETVVKTEPVSTAMEAAMS